MQDLGTPLLDSLQPPQIARDVLAAFADRHFGLSGDWAPLAGERDQNFRVTDRDGRDWVLKIGNPHEAVAVFDAQVRALEHIARTDPGLPVPRVRRARDGQAMALLDQDGRAHCGIVLSWLAGAPAGAVPLAQMGALGGLLARLGRSLRGFIHPAPAARHLAWDHRRLPDLAAHVGVVVEGERDRIARIIATCAEQTLPQLERVRRQIIHGDVHPLNLLMQDGAISGVIDFGDMISGALVQDLANTLADVLEPGGDHAAAVHAMVRGYHAVTALEEAEVDLLLPLIEARMVMNPLILRLRAEGGAPGASYGDESARSFALLDEMAAAGDRLRDAARRGAGLPPPARAPQSVEQMLDRRRAVMGSRLYMFYDTPLHLVRGQGVWLTASDGRQYLDCYNNVPHVGHCHPYVIAAIERQMRTLNTNTRYLSDEALDYAEALTATMDPSLTSVIYVNSGSEANDVAWRMAKAWTGHDGGLAMEFAYHGITDAIDPFSPSNDPGHWHAPHIGLIPPPDDYRGPYRRGEADLAARYADLADAVIAGRKVAAGMVDSAFMTNGMIEAPQGYLARVVAKIRAAGGLFIADEVQSGFGRMGSALWGHQHHGVVPDFVTIGKPAGNGHPIGIVVTRPEILDHFTKTAPFFSTFGGNNVSCAAGIAVLEVIRDEGLVENARATGAYFKARLQALQQRHALIGDVRGTGLALGVELVRDRVTLEPAAAETKALVNRLARLGVLLGSEGVHGNILKIRPPVVFAPEHVDIVVDALDRALAAG